MIQRLGIRLVHCGVPQNPAPLAPGPLVSLCRVGGAPNDRGERVFPLRHCQPLQAQSPASPVGVTAFRGPPGNEAVHGGQAPIDRVSVAAGQRSAQLLTKARILLRADASEFGEGWSDSRIAAALDTSIAISNGPGASWSRRGSRRR
jgi:hypothetical protein